MATRSLDPEQQRVLSVLLAEGQKIKDPRVRRLYDRAAVQTGLVESGLRNLSGGDADSAGWRQERASIYADPTNLNASASRFRQEFLQHYDPGEHSYQVAAQVQRPRADLRGRYQDVAGEAASILRAYSGGTAAGSDSSTSSEAPGSPAFTDPGSTDPSALVSLLGQDRRTAPPSGSLPAPAASAAPAMPDAYRALSSGQAPAPKTPDVSALLAMARTQGAAPAETQTAPVADAGAPLPASAPAKAVTGLVPLGGSKNAGKGAFEISGPSPDRLKPELTSFAEKVAAVYGGALVGKDGSTHSKLTTSGNVSEHYTGNATDIFEIGGKPAQGTTLLRAGRAALIAAGMPRAEALKAKGGLYNVGSHQIIFLTNEGGNHYDHLHISTHAR